MDASATVRLLNVTATEDRIDRSESSSIVRGSRHQISDEMLMSQLSLGNGECLGELFHRYTRTVRGLAYRVLRDASEADDLLQDLFMLIQRKCALFDPSRGSARFWILQMAYHCALGRRRYLSSRHFYTRVDLADVDGQLCDLGNGNGGRQHGDDGLAENPGLKRAFVGLSDDQQETLRLFFVEGYTLQEIAVKLNQTHGNVKHHYFRGLEKLRKHVFIGKLRSNSPV